MAVRGAKPKPHLAAVREGTFRPDKRSEGARFAPVDPVEPDWHELMPGDEETAERAGSVWARIVPALIVSAGLTDAQRECAVDYCLTAARIWQGERTLSREGLTIETDRGMVKHPMTTILNSYRAHFRSLTGELGLSPASATRVTAPQGEDEDSDVFD